MSPTTLRIIGEGPGGEVILKPGVASFINLDERGLMLTPFRGAIRIDGEGRIFYTVPFDVTLYGNPRSEARP